jgi:uncharacterized protein with FMN-binding domain
MRRAPIVLAATAAGLAAVLSFHPREPASRTEATTSAGASGRTVAGSVAMTQYGPVQVKVKVTVRGGRIADVTAVQLPQSDGRSAQISSYAAPLLREQALSAESAQVDGVSGATYTSEGFRTSLAAALSKARL